MKLSDLFNVIDSSSRIRIFRNGENEPFITNYLSCLQYDGQAQALLERDPAVVYFRSHPEIQHRLYEERGLLPPFEPEITRQYEFSDLTIFLYYDVTIE